MSMAEITMLKVGRLVPVEGSHLYLWATQSKCREDGRLIVEWAFDVAICWGFEPKNLLTWCKRSPGVGAHFQVNTEFMVYAIARDVGGKVPMTRRDGHARPTWFEATRTEHSAKPDEAYSYIERLSPGPRIDLFARRARPGWDVWGTQAPGAVRIRL